ncbi:ribosomal RNA processing protein 1 homolog B-like [Montipora foliosa]|uniref:ribosomal RNA processing protein 1 homolog B-like n=1 Tax=Montipora foliosa TaxID=591990 RepID=UPI0035F1691E
MAAGGAEEHFAKKLANNEKKIRDRAVKKLRAWIRSRPKDGQGFSDVDLLKIWKGLFYCMWMSDKPLIQEELALNISQLILSFRNENSAVLFIRAFFRTMQREWHGIDQLRLDKFYMLIRFFLKETFNFLKKSGWAERLVTDVSTIIQEEPLNPNSQAVPDGIRLHVVAIYLTELSSVADDQMTSDVLLKLMDPLFFLAAHSKNTTVNYAVKKTVFENLIQGERENLEKEQDILISKVDFAAMADRLFSLASDRSILSRNRKHLFNCVKRFRKHVRGKNEKDPKPVHKGELLNGFSGESNKSGAASEGTDMTNTLEKNDVVVEQNESRERKNKKTKKEKGTETEQAKYLCGNDKNGMKTRKRKMSKKETMGDNELAFGKKEASDEAKVEQKKKKKPSKSLGDSNVDVEMVTSKKQKLEHGGDDIEQANMVNGSQGKRNETLLTAVPTSSPFINGSRTKDVEAVNDVAVDVSGKEDSASRKAEKKLLQKAAKGGSEPFAQFRKSSISPPAFFRRCVSKTPKSAPPRPKANGVQDQTPGSEPAKGRHRRVRIEVSKNTAHTPQDYQRSLKESPRIPFDASKTPNQGLLKSPPKPQRTPLHFQKKPKQSKIAKRPKAIDFF